MRKTEQYLRLVKTLGALVMPLAAVVSILSALSIAGYIFSVEFFYRPIENGPATNPFTALCFLFISIALLGNYPSDYSRLVRKFASISVFVLITIWLFDAWFKLTLVEMIIPFTQLVQSELNQGFQNAVGNNTITMLLSITIAMLMFSVHFYSIALFASVVGLAIPLTALFGYATASQSLYGEMSFMTLTMGLFTAFAGVAAVSQFILVEKQNKDEIRAVLSLLLVVTTSIIPIIISLLLFTTVAIDKGNPIGLLIVAICWLVIQMMGLFIYAVENVESKRIRL